MKGDIRIDKKRERVRKFLREEGILPPYGQTLNDEQQKIWNEISNNNFTYYNEIKENKKQTTKKIKKSRYVVEDGVKKRIHTQKERSILKKERLLYEARLFGILPKKETNLNEQQQEIYEFICNNPETPIKSFLNSYSHLTTPENRIWYRAKKTSYKKNYNYDFNIEVGDIEIPDTCPYLNILLSTDIKDKNKDHYYSIDRIDSDKGYVKGNIQIISFLANTMKNKSTKEQLITFSKNVLYLHNT